MHYYGTFHQRLDAKGRVALPARLREQLAERDQRRLVVTGWEYAVWLYGLDEWRQLLEAAARMPAQDRAVATFNRYFFAHAAEVEPDGQGRILVPGTLREYAGLTKEVVVAGVFRRIEIWDRARWEAARPATEQDYDRINTALADYDLPL
ncbi:MAG: division/cell wall cluster transcriptional repressor MraZ [Nitrospirae bacterium]|nr:MAG: division/cell wall cluster transcriptional repressor MraZ [Nitrospirota bacterium]